MVLLIFHAFQIKFIGVNFDGKFKNGIYFQVYALKNDL